MGTSLFALSAIMQKSFQNYFDLIPTGEYNLTRVHVPIYHPDGDAISIYLRTFDRDHNIRISDCGVNYPPPKGSGLAPIQSCERVKPSDL